MKKLAALVLFLVFLFPLASCGDDEEGLPAGWPCASNDECESKTCVMQEGRGTCI